MDKKYSIEEFIEAFETVVNISVNLEGIDYLDWHIKYSGKTGSVNQLAVGLNDVLTRYGSGKEVSSSVSSRK